MSYFGINERVSDLGFYGEPTLTPPPSPLTGGGLRLRMPPAETITGYQPGIAWLTGAQLARVNRVAEIRRRSRERSKVSCRFRCGENKSTDP